MGGMNAGREPKSFDIHDPFFRGLQARNTDITKHWLRSSNYYGMYDPP